MELVLDYFSGPGLEQQGSCGGEGGYCRGAPEVRECSSVFSVHSGQ